MTADKVHLIIASEVPLSIGIDTDGAPIGDRQRGIETRQPLGDTSNYVHPDGHQ